MRAYVIGQTDDRRIHFDLQFKSKHDLLGSASSSSGPSRRTTRRALQDRVEKLKGPSSPGKTSSTPPPDDSSIWNILGFSTKGKGKDRDSRSQKTTKGKASSSSTGDGSSLAVTHETPSVPIASSRITRQTPSRLSLSKVPLSPTPTGPVQQGRQSLGAGKTRRRKSLDATSDGHLAAPRKRRKTDTSTSAELQGTPLISSSAKTPRSRSQQSTPPITTKATLNGVYQTPAAKASPGLLADKAKGLAPSATPIRRIKLIVRAPEPVYTNPKQRPLPPIFNKSVTSALASSIRLENDDVNKDALGEAARERAVLLERVHALRQQGRMLLSSEDASRARQTRPTDLRKLGADPWDHVLDAVRAHYHQRETSGPEIAATIAAKVRTYWDLQNAKEGRVKLQQEKQLRVLAKATLKLVTAEWKKAVFVSDFFRTQQDRDVNQLANAGFFLITAYTGAGKAQARRGGIAQGPRTSRRATGSVWADLGNTASRFVARQSVTQPIQQCICLSA